MGKSGKVVLLSAFILVLLFPTFGYSVSREVDLGLGTGVNFPEITSFNAKLFTDIKFTDLPMAGITPAFRAKLEPSSFIGIQLISADLSLMAQIDIGQATPYVGGGGGLVYMRSSFGSEAKFTVHGLFGIKSTVLSNDFPLFGQVKIKTFPGVDVLTQVEFGVIFADLFS